jgi:phospholipid transport system substrate-binding protein|tara:strand:+ start:594 stop:1187 length:594 start_codon:yes stop_codon:yes gene_type:complete
MKKKIFIIIFLVFGLIQNCFAYSSDPKQFITEIVDEAKEILVATNSKEFKEKKLEEIAKNTADIKGMGMYTLGKYRKNLTDEDLNEYEMLFEKYFLKSFSSRLSDYSDPKIEVISAEVLNPKYTMVRSVLHATEQKPELKIDWRVYTKNPENPLIRDLIVEGLSLARTQKEEFASIIESDNQNFNKLFSTLKEFIAK